MIKKPRKAQEGHLKEGNATRPTRDTKSGKAKQNDNKELIKSQDHKKLTKLKNSPLNQTPLTLSM
jgi:hypothetical protein